MKGINNNEIKKKRGKYSEAIMDDIPRKVYELNIKKKSVKTIVN